MYIQRAQNETDKEMLKIYTYVEKDNTVKSEFCN